MLKDRGYVKLEKKRLYGEDKGRQVKYAEAFQICEYGARPSPEQLRKLFPFFEE